MKAEIKNAIKEARKEKPGIILSAEDIYNAIYQAGMEEEAKGGTNALSYLRGVEEGEKRGMNKVVEWINKNIAFANINISYKEWQAQKKVWGIDEQIRS